MSWHYQIRKRIIDKEEFYDIVEVYDSGKLWTVHSMHPSGDTKEGLVRDIERMLADTKKYSVFEDKKK